MVKSFVPKKAAINATVKRLALVDEVISDAEWRVARKMVPVLEVSPVVLMVVFVLTICF